jgi:hypothetical protein
LLVYRNLSTDFTRSSSFLIALFAKKRSKIAKIGKNIPIPFSETEVSPDTVSDRYINNPNKKRFIKILTRPRTNCNCLFLNRKIVTNAKIDDAMNAVGIILNCIDSSKNKSTINIFFPETIHKLKTKIIPPVTMEVSNKKML